MVHNTKTGFRSYDEAQAFLYKAIDFEKLISYQYNATTFSLDRMKKLLASLGNPHNAYQTIHITGTKGKGSTAIMIATILERAGIKTGLFTSPHLIHLTERIQINSHKIPEQDFTLLLSKMQPYIQHLRDTDLSASPTYFEILTAVCLLYFKNKNVQTAVLEVGMGGRLDSTNVVLPRVSIITNIGLDHVDVLGYSISSIAYEKAGIIKHGIPVISTTESPEALSVIEKTCHEKGSPLYLLGREFRIEKVQRIERNGIKGLQCTVRTWHGTYDNIFLPLIGDHQVNNCAAAVAALEIMRERGHSAISNETMINALRHVHCPARVEVASKNPVILLDYAHTVESVQFLKKAILDNFNPRKRILIMGFSQDKDLDALIREIVELGDILIVTKSTNPRAASPEDLYQRIKRVCGKHAEVLDNTKDAIITAKKIASYKDLICITGSSYLAGEARQALEKITEQTTRASTNC